MKQLFLKNLDIELEEAQLALFHRLTTELVTTNAQFNLTAITAPEEIAVKHYLDSCFIADLIPRNIKVLDVGCGGGFPCLPLSIVRPDLLITALDSSAKKMAFVESFAKENNLNVNCVCCRAEEYHPKTSFDVCTARAVSSTSILLELLAPLTRVGGRIILFKGKQEDDTSAVEQLHLTKLSDVEYTLPNEAAPRRLCVYAKNTPTPSNFPRNYSKIKKNPL